MIYLDHNAATPLLPEVREAMEPYFASNWANPGSVHSLGRRAKQAIEHARNQLAEAIGCANSSVVFTSGATECNNAVIQSVATNRRTAGAILTTAAEHSSLLAACDRAQRESIPVRQVPIDENGEVDLTQFEAALPGALLVTTSWANNETGVISPLKQLSALCAEYGVPLHLDAAQAFGKLPLQLESLDIAYLSLSAHKIGGPKGTGALIVRQDAPFAPLVVGGDQESGRRAGTENVANIVGFGVAATTAATRAGDFAVRVGPMRNEFEAAVLAIASEATVNGVRAPRLANTSNIALPIEDALEFVLELDQRGICASVGSACHAGSLEPSHVLLAMGLPRERARRSVRFSLGYETTRREIDLATDQMRRALSGFLKPGSR